MSQDQLNDWNAFHPPGSPCTLRKDDGTEIETRTRSEAWLLGSGHAVVLIAKYTGGYSLDRLKMHNTIKGAA